MSRKLQIIFGCIIISLILLSIFLKSITSYQSEEFEEFNRQFHSDSIFQMSRINFPIGGKSVDGFEKLNWYSKNWELLKTPVGDKSLIKEYKHFLGKTNDEVIEKIWIENSGFKVERKFKRINTRWYLIYYDNTNL